MIQADGILPLHILAGTLALVSGYVALWAAKGTTLHRRSGRLFVVCMVAMSLSGAWIAFWNGPASSLIAGLLTFCFVTTGLLTVRPHAEWIDRACMLLAVVASLLAFQAGGAAWTGGRPEAVPMFIFGLVGLLAAAGDLRLIRAGGITGRHRIARHLWRMCFGMWVAAASFFWGPPRRIPEFLRIPALLPIPVLIPVVVMLYWLWRLKSRKDMPVRFDTR
jgi:uncharacterized membrane protein